MKTVRYQKMIKMDPREGTNYATTYVKQTLEQRRELCKHIKTVVGEIADALEGNEDLMDFIRTPLKGFKTTSGQNRTPTDILTDMVNEAKGVKRNGEAKDFALAPIERWNKLFKGTEYEIALVQTFGSRATNIDSLFDDIKI